VEQKIRSVCGLTDFTVESGFKLQSRTVTKQLRENKGK
jgi:hypothetical protein